MSDTVCIKMNGEQMMNLSETDNLLLNMSGGLLPEHLSQNEVKLFEDKYGENWFEKLGYTEPLYKKPVFEKRVT